MVYKGLDWISPNAIWASGTYGQTPVPVSLTLESNGNLIINTSNGATVWSSGSGGLGGAPFSLVLQANGNLAILGQLGNSVWNSQ